MGAATFATTASLAVLSGCWRRSIGTFYMAPTTTLIKSCKINGKRWVMIDSKADDNKPSDWMWVEGEGIRYTVDPLKEVEIYNSKHKRILISHCQSNTNDYISFLMSCSHFSRRISLAFRCSRAFFVSSLLGIFQRKSSVFETKNKRYVRTQILISRPSCVMTLGCTSRTPDGRFLYHVRILQHTDPIKTDLRR